MKKLMTVVLAAVLVAACDEGTGPNGTRVAIEFATAASSSSILGFGAVAASIDVEGSNGVLILDTMHVIVNEFELERVGASAGCDDDEAGLEFAADDDGMDEDEPEDDDLEDDDDCEEFETGPSLQSLPLDGGTTTVVSADVTEGEYGFVEFEIEDLEDDEDDLVEAGWIDELRAMINEEFDTWPEQASMRVVGTFTPTDGDPVSFVTFVEAEIEVELAFDSPFVVTAEDVNRTVTVEWSPADLLLRGDGTVLNLADYDYESTGMVPELELEVENGFKHVEHDDD